MTEKEVLEHEKNKTQLEMLIGDKTKSDSAVTVDKKDDQRFTSGDRDFAVDPTHKEFKKVVQGHNKVVKRHGGKKH